MADIVRTHHGPLLARWNHVLSREQRKALGDIRDCRSAALGGRVEQCDRCGHRVILYNSCRNRHCPKCQAQARARWLAQRESELLPVPYFHVVFTLPSQIGRLALQNPKQIYTILFRCAARTLLDAAAEPRLLGASIGFLAVLHTWGQNLHLHPHLHCVVPGGGISLDGTRWIGCPKSSFFLPVRLLSHRFRTSFLRSLRRAFRKGALRFHGELQALSEPAAFLTLCDQAAAIDWVVHIKPPFGGPRRVLKYLARYTHRVAISNHRLRSLENGRVRFEWKDYTHRAHTKLMTLDAVEFLRRFLLHVLPTGLMRIRQFGFLAHRVRTSKLQLCRALLAPRFPQLCDPIAPEPKDSPHCPSCKLGRLIVIELFGVAPPEFADTS
ncbi:MAG TPA: IS91 family transposase [Acidobacteriaceae bacterium]|nr:IS91 family transposase [Acidobacteriaceae bacterium]